MERTRSRREARVTTTDVLPDKAVAIAGSTLVPSGRMAPGLCRIASAFLLAILSLGLTACQESAEDYSSSGGSPAPGAQRSGATAVSSTETRVTPKPTAPLPAFAEGSVPIQLLMREYAYLPNPLRIPAGKKVTLILINRGTMPHEFQAGVGMDATGDAFQQDLFDGLEVQTAGGVPDTRNPPPPSTGDTQTSTTANNAAGEKTSASSPSPTGPPNIVIAPGHTAFMTFTLPIDRRGEWDMGCFDKKHSTSSMRGKLQVE